MKRFKSISVTEDTYEAVSDLAETLFPKVKLSKSQVVEKLVKSSHGDINNHQENTHDENTTTKAS